MMGNATITEKQKKNLVSEKQALFPVLRSYTEEEKNIPIK